jgi:hypothetical protein
MRPVNRASTVVLLVLALSGCTQTGGAVNKGEGAVTYDASSGASDSAAFSGVLVFENGCVRFANGTIPILPAEETSWDGEVLVLNGVTYQIGDTVEVSGGEVDRDVTPVEVPERCGDGSLWVVAPSS